VGQLGSALKNLFATADNITATLVALVVIARLGQELVSRTVGRRRSLQAKLNSLGPLVNDEYIRGLFGAPPYGRLDSEGNGTLVWDVGSGYLAVLFEDRTAQTLEFTVTDRRLRFSVATFTQGICKGVLGASPFAAMVTASSGQWWLGARRASY
jgi:hypothetical protein